MLDTSALTQPTDQQLADVARREKAGEFGPSPSVPIVKIVIITVIGLYALGMLARFFAMWGTVAGEMSTFPRMGGNFGFIFTAFPIFFVAMLIVVVIPRVLNFARRGDWRKIAAFAVANGMHFTRRPADPGYPGLLFGIGRDRVFNDCVWSPDGELAGVGRYSYVTGSDDNSTTHRWTYAAFRLSRPMPHLVLDNRGNDGLGRNLPTTFSRGQLLTVGDLFDKQWRLYAPAGYGADTYQIFTPDVIEALVSGGYTCDIEIVDDWLFLYSKSASLADPSLWRQIERIQQTVVGRIISGSYIDRRLEAQAPTGQQFASLGQPSAPIAPQGRRLRTAWRGWVGICLVAIVIAWMAMLFAPLFTAF